MKDGIHSRYRSLTCGPLVVSSLQVARKDNSLMVHEWLMIQYCYTSDSSLVIMWFMTSALWSKVTRRPFLL